MKPAPFEYLCAASVAEASTALEQAKGTGKVIAGGQSLGPMLNLRLVRPDLLVDIGRIAELSVCEDRAASWFIGAATTHAALEDGRTPIGADGFIPSVARGIAYRAIRNRGTIGGSLAHADPAADWILILTALGASVEIAGRHARRRQTVGNFMVATFTADLADAELLVGVEIPKLGRAARCGYHKLCRKLGEFAEASAVIVIDSDRGLSRVVIGALGARPQELPEVAEMLGRHGPSTISAGMIAAAVAQAAPHLDPIDRHLHAASVSRAVQKAFA